MRYSEKLCRLGLATRGFAFGRRVAVVSVLGVCFLASRLSAQVNIERPDQRTAQCATGSCHPGIVGDKVVHRPVLERSCMECHKYVDAATHVFTLTTPKEQLCQTCHELDLDQHVHTPVVEADCMGCHDPHGSDHPMILTGDPGGGLCMNCHADDYSHNEFVHGPVAAGACIVCHTAHSSSFAGLLRGRPDSLCLQCHTEMEVPNDPTIHQHRPFTEGCVTCHDPHASDSRYQLHTGAPELCFECHGGIGELINESIIAHGPAVAEGGCSDCHNPHFSRQPKLQRDPQPELCLDCHDEVIETADGRQIRDIALVLAEHENHHGPIRQGECTVCHQPHASDHFRLLQQDYPQAFYAEFEMEQYRLCFSCHQADLVKERSAQGLTGFRDGDVNLHWLHVNQEKGRTCRACHEVHASSQPFHIRDSVPFGESGWELKINFEQTETGGSCSPGCHKAKTYDRKKRRSAFEEE